MAQTVRRNDVRSASGIPVPVAAGPADVAEGLGERLGAPGEFPFTRGLHPSMYRERPWTIRQLAGFGTAEDTNARYRLLLERGATAVNGVFDYPSLRAFGSDDERARADVGRGGVAVDVRDDFEVLFRDIAVDEISVSLVSSQPIGAVPHLAMYLAMADGRGIPRASLAGTSQNDFLMETAVTIAPAALPPTGSFRLECDLVEFAVRELPRWNPVSITGYNYREAGADAPLELALSIAHGQAVARELVDRGLSPEDFLPRMSFFLCAHNDFFEEVAKFRAARRMWSTWVRDELGVGDPRSQRFRFHTQTSGATNVGRYAHVNIARSSLQALAAVLGGTQSLHVNGYDEALTIPTEHAALTALRTQYVLLHETGVTASADPLGGSWLVEHMTDAVEEAAGALVREIDATGGVVEATRSGWVHRELGARAFAYQQAIESGERLVVGVNTQCDGPDEEPELFALPADAAERQAERIAQVLRRRDDTLVAKSLDALAVATADGSNVVPATIDAVAADATLGEIGDVYRRTLGTWQFPLW